MRKYHQQISGTRIHYDEQVGILRVTYGKTIHHSLIGAVCTWLQHLLSLPHLIHPYGVIFDFRCTESIVESEQDQPVSVYVEDDLLCRYPLALLVSTDTQITAAISSLHLHHTWRRLVQTEEQALLFIGYYGTSSGTGSP